MTKLVLGEMDTTEPWKCWYIRYYENCDYSECYLKGIDCRGNLVNRPAECPLVEVKDEMPTIPYESIKPSVNDGELKFVKCCASCEYRDDTTLVAMSTIRCSAYATRQPKIYEVCETFYPDVDIWGSDKVEVEKVNPADLKELQEKCEHFNKVFFG